MKGLGRSMPWTMGALILGGLSLIGVPGTVGFISKWHLILGTLEAGYWPIAVLIVGSSLLAVIYIWKIVEVAYLENDVDQNQVSKEVPISMLAPLWVLVILNFYFGIDADLTTWVARNVAETFLGGGA